MAWVRAFNFCPDRSSWAIAAVRFNFFGITGYSCYIKSMESSKNFFLDNPEFEINPL